MKKIKRYILGLLTVGLGILIFGPISAFLAMSLKAKKMLPPPSLKSSNNPMSLTYMPEV